KAFSMQNPSASVPALARGLAATRMAIERLSAERDAVFTLRVKEQQFQDAINTALGIELQAIAGVPGPAVPGQRISVETSLTNRGSIGIDDITFELVAPPQSQPVGAVAEHLGANETVWPLPLTLIVSPEAPLTRPYFERASIQEARYAVRDTTQLFRPA